MWKHLYFTHSPMDVWGVCHSKQNYIETLLPQAWRTCAGFVFSEDLSQHFLWMLLVSSGPYQTWFSRLISCQLVTFLKDRLVTWARPFPFPGQHRSNIGYEYLKWLALRNIRSLACVTKPTVCKQSKCRYSPLQTTMNWWYNCQKIADTRMVWAEKFVCETLLWP